jgi:hypothetical protein
LSHRCLGAPIPQCCLLRAARSVSAVRHCLTPPTITAAARRRGGEAATLDGRGQRLNNIFDMAFFTGRPSSPELVLLAWLVLAPRTTTSWTVAVGLRCRRPYVGLGHADHWPEARFWHGLTQPDRYSVFAVFRRNSRHRSRRPVPSCDSELLPAPGKPARAARRSSAAADGLRLCSRSRDPSGARRLREVSSPNGDLLIRLTLKSCSYPRPYQLAARFTPPMITTERDRYE